MKLSIAKKYLISKVAFCWFFAAAATSCKREPQPSGSEVKTQTSEVKAQTSKVKALPSEMELYLIQTHIERSCCSIVSNENGYLICVKETIKKRGVEDYLAVVKEFKRRATSHGKTFTDWICGNNVRVE